MNIHYNDPNLYVTCNMCNVNQHNSGFRFESFKCRLCFYLHGYRYKHTRDRFREYVERCDIEVRSYAALFVQVIHEVASSVFAS